MVITPSTNVFNEMINQLPKVYKYTTKRHYKEDPLTSGFGQQAATTAFFLSNETDARKRCVLKHDGQQFVSRLIVSSETCSIHTAFLMHIQWYALQPWVAQ